MATTSESNLPKSENRPRQTRRVMYQYLLTRKDLHSHRQASKG